MAAPESTKFQVNYKLADGTLVNIYAVSAADLEAQLTTLQDTAALIISTSDIFRGSGSPAPVSNTAAPAPVAAPVQAGNVCKHGTMAYREGVNAAGKAWKGYMCSAPRGATDKCPTIWVR